MTNCKRITRDTREEIPAVVLSFAVPLKYARELRMRLDNFVLIANRNEMVLVDLYSEDQDGERICFRIIVSQIREPHILEAMKDFCRGRGLEYDEP